jgi:ABC-2 type transport system permease protein
MLMEVKNQIKVLMLSVKYNIMRQMVNKVTFITNIIFMILNNAGFIVQWIILFGLKDEIGGYTIKEVILLWGMAAGVFGTSHIFFYKAFEMPDLIINGKLDTFLVQPKNIFLSVISSDTSISAIGDLIYGYICLFIYGFSIKNLILFTLFSITGGIILTAFASILGSLCFWITKGDILAESLTNVMINFATYPGTIFKTGVKLMLYTVIPVGIANYLPVDTILNFNIAKFLYIIIFTISITVLAFVIFNKGLKKYSSSNLMSSRI